jgi:hypothetical protein
MFATALSPCGFEPAGHCACLQEPWNGLTDGGLDSVGILGGALRVALVQMAPAFGASSKACIFSAASR